MRFWLVMGLLTSAAAASAQETVPERGSVEVGGRSAFETASRSGGDQGRKFCIRVMYNVVPLSLYGEMYVEGNATPCENTSRLDVDKIVLRYKYRGEPVRSKECSNTYQCEFAERFYRTTKDVECAAVTAISGNWSATAETAPGCL